MVTNSKGEHKCSSNIIKRLNQNENKLCCVIFITSIVAYFNNTYISQVRVLCVLAITPSRLIHKKSIKMTFRVVIRTVMLLHGITTMIARAKSVRT